MPTLGMLVAGRIALVEAAIYWVVQFLDGTSVNPARSLGPALFEGGTALSHVWVYIVAPLIGGVLATLAWPLVEGQGWRYRARPDDAVPDSGARIRR